MQCPQCNSNDTVSCPIAYDQGTSLSKSSSSVSGIVTSSGQPGVISGSGTTTTESHTPFAMRAAPPKMPFSIIGMGFFLAPVCIMIALFAHSLQFWLNCTFGIIGIWIVYAMVQDWRGHPIIKRREWEEWRHAMGEWQRTWICKSCGSKFFPR
jgi:hypothetical protein